MILIKAYYILRDGTRVEGSIELVYLMIPLVDVRKDISIIQKYMTDLIVILLKSVAIVDFMVVFHSFS